MSSSVTWTEEQQKVISLRNRNILVSAAAGSGKTAVLVERIITMISDVENPVDIDKLLVVTFTNAAAAEMSERISAALEKKIEQDPENMFLRRQVTLVRNAHICTFHSFCQSVIRNHFNEIGIDPSFRIGDETELTLMKNDVMEALFEKHYAEYADKKGHAAKQEEVLKEKDQAFVKLIESYSDNKTDEGLRAMVLQLYQFSMSYPWPEQWLDKNKEAFQVQSLEEMEQSQWMQFLMEYLVQIVEDVKRENQKALEICAQADGPDMYQDALLDDGDYIGQIAACKTYSEFSKALSGHKWARLSAKKSDTVDPDKRNLVKAIRDQIKKTLDDVKKQFFFQDAGQMLLDMQSLALPMEALMELTKEFKQEYQKAKEEKRVVDFNDLEHYALAILLDENTGNPTSVADAYREEFAEILVDEYQDSNEVQETILGSICKREPDAPNLFMVGDVKQSIYKFRMARPELFMEKYDSYSLSDSLYQRIDLHKNFRSRAIVLDSVNEIFEIIMKKSLGKVEYDDSAALYLGNESFVEGERSAKQTELLLVELDGDTDNEETVKEEEEVSKIEWEARMVQMRIKELVDPDKGLMVIDKKNGELRPCRYGDIAILLRTMSGWSDTYLEVLKDAGVPVYTDTRTGYFSTYEIRTMLQFLKVLDNPRQDIPLAAVMRSMFGSFTGEEMAIMRNRYPDMDLIDTVECYGGLYELCQGSDKDTLSLEEQMLSKKADAFLEKISSFRKRVAYTSIHQLLERIYEETGFYDYVSVMPNGAQRRDNLDMLVQKAIDMEATNLTTLFHFNRYIEKIHKYEVDFGEAIDSETAENAVRIMSIHKSKGLEFPVVIVGGMAKTFNQQDARGKVVLHLDAGIGPDVVDVEHRTKTPSLIKRVIAKQSTLENLGEELRVLYVALTRAKEKLIMAGTVGKKEDLDQCHLEKEGMSYFQRSSASSYLDWVAPVVLDSESEKFSFRIYDLQQLVSGEVMEQVKAAVKKEELLSWDREKVYDDVFLEQLEDRKQFSYAYEREMEIKSKLSVSELKKAAMELQEIEELGQPLYEESDSQEIPMPAFLKEEAVIQGAGRGTIYHKVFEKLVLGNIETEKDVWKEIERMQERGFLTDKEAAIVNRKDIYQFVTSSVGQRMKVAENKNLLYKERPFVIGLPARTVKQQWDSDEMILVQGIIDAYFEEQNEIVLLDYKTDKVDDGEKLVKKYKEQLDYYQKALEQVTGKKVKEKIIYSVTLGEEWKL